MSDDVYCPAVPERAAFNLNTGPTI